MAIVCLVRRLGAILAAAGCAIMLLAPASALDNGMGMTPPRGWRSWDAFENSVNQTLQQNQVDAMVDRSRTVDGKITSLLELGYNRIGLDDAWQVPSTVHALYRGLTYILYLVQNEMTTIHSAME